MGQLASKPRQTQTDEIVVGITFLGLCCAVVLGCGESGVLFGLRQMISLKEEMHAKSAN